MTDIQFKKTIWDYYHKRGRDLPWRENITPYRIVVSEIMLQQTQASRVAKKFDSFIKKFPNWKTLADAPLQDILKEWQGLGYNRRAINLQKIARIVETDYRGKLPKTYEELLDFPSIGPNTAGSILAFAFNIPHPFIETNIRSVFIHFFFNKTKIKIDDKKIIPLIVKTLDKENPCEWYYALMDYGAFLKANGKNPSQKSKHHVKQSKFKGSNRELRSHILKSILLKPMTESNLLLNFPHKEKEIILKNLFDLKKEGFIKKKKPKEKTATYEIN